MAHQLLLQLEHYETWQSGKACVAGLRFEFRSDLGTSKEQDENAQNGNLMLELSVPPSGEQATEWVERSLSSVKIPQLGCQPTLVLGPLRRSPPRTPSHLRDTPQVHRLFQCEGAWKGLWFTDSRKTCTSSALGSMSSPEIDHILRLRKCILVTANHSRHHRSGRSKNLSLRLPP